MEFARETFVARVGRVARDKSPLPLAAFHRGVTQNLSLNVIASFQAAGAMNWNAPNRLRMRARCANRAI